MAVETSEQLALQRHLQASIRVVAVRVAAPATGSASEIALAQIAPASVQATAGVVEPNALLVLRAAFVPDVNVAAAGGTNYGTLSIGVRAGATGVAGADLTGTLNNQGALTAYAEAALVATAQAVAAGSVLTLKNTPTLTGGAWQAGVVVLHIQE